MDSVWIGDVAVHYRYRPAADGAATVVFVNSLGTDFRIWDGVIERIDERVGILTYDKRGHGLSGLGATPYSMDTLAGDLAGLMDLVAIRKAVISGLSVGGQVAQQLYFDRPDLVSGLMLSDTAAKIGEPEFWHQRIETISRSGLSAAADGIMERWFSNAFRTSQRPEYALARAMFERQSVDGYLATCAAIAAFDRRMDSGSIDVPVSVLVGSEDGATPPDLVESFAATIPGAVFDVVAEAGHLPCIESPVAVARAITALVSRIS